MDTNGREKKGIELGLCNTQKDTYKNQAKRFYSKCSEYLWQQCIQELFCFLMGDNQSFLNEKSFSPFRKKKKQLAAKILALST